METLQLKITFLFLLFVVTLLAGIFPVKLLQILRKQVTSDKKRRRWPSITLCSLSCFNGGVFLATCFLHLLPEVRQDYFVIKRLFNWDSDYPLAELISCLGFFLVFFIEEMVMFCLSRRRAKRMANEENVVVQQNEEIPSRSIASDRRDYQVVEMLTVTNSETHRHPTGSVEEDPLLCVGLKLHPHNHEVRSLTFLAALSVHSLIEGFALGVQTNNEGVIALFVSIVIHKCIVAFGVGVQLARTHVRKFQLILLFMIIFAAMTPVGCSIGISLHQGSMQTSTRSMVNMVLNGLSVGTFLYVTFFEVFHHELENCENNLLKLLSAIIGFSTIGFLRVLNHDHGHLGHDHSLHDMLNSTFLENSTITP
ncbi:Zinc transporter ZIP3 [Trichinella zimbabwensis]|uniref:Zinc transporter ZIP3 n=1 Tax=Trichinella zimbabwensis TaxID=268475 RepID=A0A0V1I4S0_9BILA|nr:Zinc transporter ZIP3 [Trichinella zimbabwensis]